METLRRFFFSPEHIESLLDPLFGDSLHSKRLRSLADGTIGVLYAAEVGLAAIGRGLAAARLLDPKHAIKQIDRLVSNKNVSPWLLSPLWAKHCLHDKKEIRINLDWTDFQADDHTTLVAALQTTHGRAEALLWKTYKKSSLKNNQRAYEKEFLEKLREIIPSDLSTTIIADRGFGATTIYETMNELKFDYIVRFRQNIHISHGTYAAKPASEWANTNGRMKTIRQARITQQAFPVASVFLMQDKGMKDPWCIVSSNPTLESAKAKAYYAKRFTIEELFRDVKDGRYGLGLNNVRIEKESRRDVMIWLIVLAVWLLTELGQAGEDVGMDKKLKVNTSPKRQHSLLKQGLFWMMLLPGRSDQDFLKLTRRFGERLQDSVIFRLLSEEK